MSSPAPPQKTIAPENLLFRSHIEICRVIKILAEEHCPVSAQIMKRHPFSSHLLAVDAINEHFVIAYSPHKQINSMVLDSKSVEFTSFHLGQHFTFEATSPEQCRFEGLPAIQFCIPRNMLIHNRREHPRIDISEATPLRCIADEAGYIPFESHITDISLDGFACLVYNSDIFLHEGNLLKGCRIILPNGDAVIADLELRYVTPTTLSDGTHANRAGLRFTKRPDKIEKLMNYFVQDLGK